MVSPSQRPLPDNTQHLQQTDRHQSMPPVGIETTISADERPQTFALNRAAPETGFFVVFMHFFSSFLQNNFYKLYSHSLSTNLASSSYKIRKPEFITFCYWTSCLFVCFWRDSPQWARASSLSKFLDHIQRRTTVSGTPLDEWSARRRDLYLATHTVLTTNKRPCPRWDSNPQSQQASGRRPTP